MAEIIPFRAWRYNEAKVKDIRLKFSPLFDVVNAKQLAELYQIPNNSIHLSVPTSHQDALDKLNGWIEEQVLLQDEKPAIYVYYQYFTLYGQKQRFVRKGFITMVRLDEGAIIEHEATMPHSVNDRTALLEKTYLNVAPTHGLYEDPAHALDALMDRYAANPLHQYIDYQGVINTLSIVDEPADITQFQQLLRQQPIYLADGHHRLESSKLMRDRLAAQGKLSPDALANYHLIYLSNLHADDLRILPTHRIWKSEAEWMGLEATLEQLQQYFELEEVSQTKKPLYELLQAHTGIGFGMMHGYRQWILTLKPALSPLDLISRNLPEALKRLDYTLLHELVFDKTLGIPYEVQHQSPSLRYEKDYASTIEAAEQGQADLCFFMKEVDMQQMLDICKAGAKMPPKSTYFYPKVVCGLVFASIKDEHNA